MSTAPSRRPGRRWRVPGGRLTPLDRGRLLARVAQLLRRNGPPLAKMECLDSGKPLSHAARDIERAAAYFDYYAGICDKLHGETIPLGRDRLCFTLRQPVGVTAHIVPWNVPLPIAARGDSRRRSPAATRPWSSRPRRRR